jgi:hypothetical protein
MPAKGESRWSWERRASAHGGAAGIPPGAANVARRRTLVSGQDLDGHQRPAHAAILHAMKAILVPLALALLAACSTNSEPAGNGTSDPNTTANATPVAVPAAVREVRCGCRIDGINQCGNYVDVDGKWLEITNPADHNLGVMEWCKHKDKVEAQVAGVTNEKGLEVSTLTVQ